MPKRFKELTEQEQGALLLAHHNRKPIMIYDGTRWVRDHKPKWLPDSCYASFTCLTIYGALDSDNTWQFSTCESEYDTLQIVFSSNDFQAKTYVAYDGTHIRVNRINYDK